MTEAYMNFGEYYDKLDRPIFPSLRSSDHFGDIGDKLKITVEGDQELGEALVVGRSWIKLGDLPTPLLLYDTGRDTRDRAIKDLKEYYPDLNESSPIYLYTLLWSDRSLAELGEGSADE